MSTYFVGPFYVGTHQVQVDEQAVLRFWTSFARANASLLRRGATHANLRELHRRFLDYLILKKEAFDPLREDRSFMNALDHFISSRLESESA